MKGLGINYMKRKKASSNSVKNVLLKGWLLKEQTHFFQSKNIRIKNFKGKKGPFGVLLHIIQKKTLFHRHKNRSL
jgi:hypothetical protein